ncbi:MAG TPA: DNA polymerase III subunit gamma/tau [Actinomycetota bacterium]|nr:DNA polymerase III subunit gamma/tau [Actinomycetota bacterium]
MAYLSLYRKYRPQTFDEILGQDHVSKTLANAIVEDRVAHAYLFTGPRGTGKTSTARILAKALNCEQGPTTTPCGKCPSCVAIANGSSMDVIELDAASHSGVDDTRDILQGVALATAGGRRKVYVIDEVHMLTTPSFNALLKTLEEPPPHVVFILATTEAHKVLHTIQSRTQRFDFRPISAEVLEKHLADIAAKEGIEIDAGALGIVARHAEGGARDALSTLDQLRSLGAPITAEDAERVLGGRDDDAFIELFDVLASSDLGGIFWAVHSLVAKGTDVRQLARGALGHARSLLLLCTAPQAAALLDASEEDRAALEAQAKRFSTDVLLRTVDLLARALADMREAPNHRLLFEVALIRASTAAPAEGRPAPHSAPLEAATTPHRSRVPERPTTKPAGDAAAAGRPAAPDKDAAAASAPRPKAEPPGEAAATPPPAPAEVGFGHFKDAWPAAQREVRRSSQRVAALLNPSRPVDYADGILSIEVQSDFHVEEMSGGGNYALLADAVQAAVGVRPRLTFLTSSGAKRERTPARAGRSETATSPTVEEEESVAEFVEAAPIADAAHDPVELVKKGFGAEVVEER